MTNYFIVPGLGGSGENHWQTHFEKSGKNFQRIEQQNWDAPHLIEWASNIENAIAPYDASNVILVGHSLGCLTIALWAKQYGRNIKGAFLVAPPDTALLREKVAIDLQDEISNAIIHFPTLLVASTTDHWASIEKAGSYANNWGSQFINIGPAGHINEQSGHGAWHQGLELLRSFDKKAV